MNTDNIVYLNGALVPESEAVVPVTERGFFGGDGIYEVTRTFGHTLFRLDAHLDRLFRSLAYARIEPGLSRDELTAATLETLGRNLGRLDADGDFALWHVICRGDNVMGAPSPTIVAMFCVEVDPSNYAHAYVNGLRLMTPGVRRTPPSSIDPRAKVLSRMNQIQASMEAKGFDPGATPLMLDGDGNIAETNTGNFFFIADGKLFTSAARNVLGGVTRATILELADELGIKAAEGNYTSYDVYAADEAFICSTTPVIVPAVSLNGVPIGGTAEDATLPGPVTLRLMNAFIERTGVDFVAQAASQLGGNSSKGLADAWGQRLEALD